MSKQNHCMDCGAKISRSATRCSSCAKKALWQQGAYDDRAEYQRLAPRCIDCGAAISTGCTRCQSCAVKQQWKNGDLGNEEWRLNQSERIKAAHARGDFGEEWYQKTVKNLSKLWESEEHRHTMSKAIQSAWARGVYGEEWSRAMSEKLKAAHQRGDFDEQPAAMRELWKQGVYDGVFHSPTSIEIKIADALDSMGIEHQPQYRPEGYGRPFDEFISPNILIEVQGDYWHGDKRPEQQRRDAEKAQWAQDHGFELFEIWEHEINELGAQQALKLRFQERG